MSLGEEIVELLTHADDAISHSLDLGFPFLVKTFVAQDSIGNSGTVERRVRVHGSDDNLQLTFDSGTFLGVGADKGESTNTFTVETHVLGERLCESDLVALFDEVSDGEGVTSGIARGETLVGHVEEREEFPLFYDIGNFFPLGLSRVHTGWIVGTCVEEDDGTFRSIL